MPGKIFKTPRAKQDLIDLAVHISQENLDAALRFLDTAESAFYLLADRPELGTVCNFRSPRATGIRVWSIEKFQNYLIFYRDVDSGIEIVRILHGARNVEQLFADDTD